MMDLNLVRFVLADVLRVFESLKKTATYANKCLKNAD
jgi:hypothetical protein